MGVGKFEEFCFLAHPMMLVRSKALEERPTVRQFQRYQRPRRQKWARRQRRRAGGAG